MRSNLKEIYSYWYLLLGLFYALRNMVFRSNGTSSRTPLNVTESTKRSLWMVLYVWHFSRLLSDKYSNFITNSMPLINFSNNINHGEGKKFFEPWSSPVYNWRKRKNKSLRHISKIFYDEFQVIASKSVVHRICQM